MLLAAGGIVLLTPLGVDSTHAAHVLLGLLVIGLGLALATAMGTATLGVRPDDAGVASATVNTMQQIGGSIGTALLTVVNLDRFNAAFGIGSAGFSEGMVCVPPDRPTNEPTISKRSRRRW